MNDHDVRELLELIAYCDPIRAGLPARTIKSGPHTSALKVTF
jgi:hypothetical protein